MNQPNQSNPDQMSLIERVLSITREIDQAVQLANWSEAARLADERSPHLMSITGEQTPAALALVRQIQAIDAALVANAKAAQAELQVEYRNAMDRLGAASAYQAAAQF
ncbi:flagellar protein FliT [Burkholderia sp. TSV86]|uniref:flagellar protein FliT n=1 Tax=Burkholderia sp. TSV86 TaxID=1385594 RepID=UPI0007599EA8|nr:flagellar protein FliT [Burkholderia sp. TSV86]KVE35113.1 flagellar protein FliT [Burkholderia sp. TSV86]